MKLSNATLAVDVMGADLGPKEIIHGIKLAIDEYENLPNLTLVGQEDVIKKYLKEFKLEGVPSIKIVHASEVIGMDEKPIQGIRHKKDSSMVRSLDLVKEGECQAVLSCGNTGGLMAGGVLKLRPMAGISRPALSCIIPSKDHHFVLTDAGANPDTDPKHLAHNAILGSIHARIELGTKNPKVGLLTIGTEEGKGTERIHETHEYLKGLDGIINYTGLIEGYHLFQKDVDVVVCDGFVGNILIKSFESLFRMLLGLLHDEVTQTPLRKFGAGFLKGAFRSVKTKLDPDRYGSAPLMGVNGIVLKAHGSSNRYAIMNAIKTASRMFTLDINNQIQKDISEANAKMKAMDEVKEEAAAAAAS